MTLLTKTFQTNANLRNFRIGWALYSGGDYMQLLPIIALCVVVVILCK